MRSRRLQRTHLCLTCAGRNEQLMDSLSSVSTFQCLHGKGLIPALTPLNFTRSHQTGTFKKTMVLQTALPRPPPYSCTFDPDFIFSWCPWGPWLTGSDNSPVFGNFPFNSSCERWKHWNLCVLGPPHLQTQACDKGRARHSDQLSCNVGFFVRAFESGPQSSRLKIIWWRSNPAHSGCCHLWVAPDPWAGT